MRINSIYFSFFLISISGFSQSKIIFSYDTTGNQLNRIYCENGDCIGKKQTEQEQENSDVVEESSTRLEAFDESVSIFPNPTEDLVTITWNLKYSKEVSQIMLVDILTKIHSIPHQSGENKIHIDFYNWPSGLYIVRILLHDGNIISKKIIKQ